VASDAGKGRELLPLGNRHLRISDVYTGAIRTSQPCEFIRDLAVSARDRTRGCAEMFVGRLCGPGTHMLSGPLTSGMASRKAAKARWGK
jgi:hypothetical protein